MCFMCIIRAPGTGDPGGLMFYCWLQPITVKLCHMIGSMSCFIIQVPNMGDFFPTKFGDHKNSTANISGTNEDNQNSFLFWVSSFVLWILMYPQRFLLRSPKKSGELWFTNDKVGHVSLDPPKSTFSKDHISAPRRRCPSNFFTR